MTSATLIKGFPSTSGDDYQLNTITLLKNANRNFPEVEIVSRNQNGSPFRYSYRQAYHRVCKLANALKRIGIVPGDRVGVMEWNTHRFYELYFAISGIGATLVQLNPRISNDDRAYVINHSGAKFVFVTEWMIPLIEGISKELKSVEGYGIISDNPVNAVNTGLTPRSGYEEMLENEPAEFDWQMIDERSAYSACYTSGTTGRPKGVYYSHRCIYLHTLIASVQMNISMNDVVMQTVPMFHCHGWGFFFCATMIGAKLVIPGIYTIESVNVLVDLMIAEKVTVTAGAPAIFMPMLEYIRTLPNKPDFTNLRMASGATEPSLALMKGFRDLGGAEIIHAYGATETTPFATANLLKPSLAAVMSDEQRFEYRKKQGIPVSGLDLKVVDFEGREVPHDGKTVGEILIRGPWITTSYYNDSRSDDSFENGYWKSGDAGTIDENGYLKVSDRFKDLIKSGGEWISSIDLENAIMAHPDVLEAAVVGIPHPKWQERPMALVVLRKNLPKPPNKTEILDFVAPRFSKWQLPDELLFVSEIPKTSVGKFSKKDIRQKYGNAYSNDAQEEKS